MYTPSTPPSTPPSSCSTTVAPSISRIAWGSTSCTSERKSSATISWMSMLSTSWWSTPKEHSTFCKELSSWLCSTWEPKRKRKEWIGWNSKIQITLTCLNLTKPISLPFDKLPPFWKPTANQHDSNTLTISLTLCSLKNFQMMSMDSVGHLLFQKVTTVRW